MRAERSAGGDHRGSRAEGRARRAAWAALLVALSACVTEKMRADEVCKDVGYAIANRTLICTGDGKLAQARYDRFADEYACRLSADDPPDKQTLYYYRCPVDIRRVPCERVEEYGDDLDTLMLVASPICGSILEHEDGAPLYSDRPEAAPSGAGGADVGAAGAAGSPFPFAGSAGSAGSAGEGGAGQGGAGAGGQAGGGQAGGIAGQAGQGGSAGNQGGMGGQPVAPCPGQGSLSPPVVSPFLRSVWLSAGDVDGDGKADLAGTGPQYSFNVALGDGKGAFAGVKEHSAPQGPSFGELVELTSDGKLDFACVRGQDGLLGVMAGDGKAGFGGEEIVAVSPPIRRPIFVDWDGDGRLDLVSLGQKGTSLDVKLGFGDGSFLATLTGAYAAESADLAVVDLDGDGRLDVAAVGVKGVLTVFFSGPDGKLTGDGKAQTALDGVQSSDEITWLRAADLDGDGDGDLVVGARGAQGAIWALLNDGHGALSSRPRRQIDPPAAFEVGDVDADGRPDVVITRKQAMTVDVHAGMGDGTFGPSDPHAASGFVEALGLLDVSGDGRLDVVASLGQGEVAVMLSVCPGGGAGGQAGSSGQGGSGLGGSSGQGGAGGGGG